jgi:hypothetical protein
MQPSIPNANWPTVVAMRAKDQQALMDAWQRLEHPSLAARLTSKLGVSIEKFFELLPDSWYSGMHAAIQRSLQKSLDVAIFSLGKQPERVRRRRYHKVISALSGAAGGVFGLPSVLAELPLTSTLILRSVADIARNEGEDLNSLETRLACMEVFALGGRSRADDAAETGYYGIRLALAMHFSTISERVAAQGIVKWSPPGLVRLIAEISARFGVVVTQKAAAQMVPVLGAATGAVVNLIFLEHFQEIARAHFTIRRLERAYGERIVRQEYLSLTQKLAI